MFEHTRVWVTRTGPETTCFDSNKPTTRITYFAKSTFLNSKNSCTYCVLYIHMYIYIYIYIHNLQLQFCEYMNICCFLFQKKYGLTSLTSQHFSSIPILSCSENEAVPPASPAWHPLAASAIPVARMMRWWNHELLKPWSEKWTGLREHLQETLLSNVKYFQQKHGRNPFKKTTPTIQFMVFDALVFNSRQFRYAWRMGSWASWTWGISPTLGCDHRRPVTSSMTWGTQQRNVMLNRNVVLQCGPPRYKLVYNPQ